MHTIEEVLSRSKELRHNGRNSDAIEFLTKALEEWDDASLYFARAIHYELLDEVDHALDNYRAAISLAPTNITYRLRRASLLAEMSFRDQDAIEECRAILDLDDNCVEAHQTICLCLLRVGLHEEALDHAVRASSLKPEEALSHFCLGEALMAADRYDEAADALSKAINLNGGLAHYWAALGRAQYSTKSEAYLDEASRSYAEACRLNPESQSNLYSLAKLHFEAGRPREAQRLLNAALSLEPNEGQRMLIQHCLDQANEQII